MKVRRKLIEVSLPLEKINAAAAREKSIRHGHPSTLHLWWARRPLAAARAVIFAQLVDDPSEYIDDPAGAEKERQRLHRLIEQLVLWENTTNELLIKSAREEIRKSWRRTCADNADHPRAAELFDPERMPAFHDPFAGGGALPLEAHRLGLEAYASDINPVAVLINKAMIEIPPRFADRPPVNPGARLMGESWERARGLAEDVRYYGKWMRDEAERRIGQLYPSVQVTAEMARDRPDLKSYVGRSLTVIAWLWARTVKSPNPAYAHAYVPLVSTFLLSSKPGREAYVSPLIDGDSYRFIVKRGKSSDPSTSSGTKVSQGAFRCLLSGIPFRYEYIDDEANAGRMGERLLAMVADGGRERVYLSPVPEHEALAKSVTPAWKPDTPSRGTWASNAQGRRYGFQTFGDYFTPRQLVALTTLSDLVNEARARVVADGVALEDSSDYADAIATYLAFAVSGLANLNSNISSWRHQAEAPRSTFSRQAIQMAWDYCEGNAIHEKWEPAVARVADVLAALPVRSAGMGSQADARIDLPSRPFPIVSTDPPYYDNIGYADLSDFFYVWLRRSLRQIHPALFAVLATPKAEELIANRYRHGDALKAERFFLDGMTKAMHLLATHAHQAFPVTIYYAFKQAETASDEGVASTGWETFLEAVIKAGFQISGTWPVRTEAAHRMIGSGTNALASSIVLVCRPRDAAAGSVTRRDFVGTLKAELPKALAHLQASNTSPVDLAQAVIGPGMAVFTRYARVLDAEGAALGVREALALINRTLDEALADQEGDYDADSRWALAWFDEFGFAEGDYGRAEQLSKSKATSVDAMVKAGILSATRGRVRLLRPSELDPAWDPATDRRRPTWQAVHQLVRAAEDGEVALAALVRKLGPEAQAARELAYRLYVVSERMKRPAEALWYNGLVQSWAEAQRLAADGRGAQQTALFTEA